MRYAYTCIFLAALALAAPQASAAQTSAPRNGELESRASALRGYGSIEFPNSFTFHVDNRFFPLAPGTSLTYRGHTQGTSAVKEVYVTDRTKPILGVACAVVRSRVAVNGQPLRECYDYYAQGRDGIVWCFGQDIQLYEGGRAAGTAGSWQAGVNGAQPGVVVTAGRSVTTDEFPAGYAGRLVQRTGSVLGVSASAAVPYGRFTGCLLIEEWTPIGRGIIDQKLYAPNVGLVFANRVRGFRERWELVNVEGGPAVASIPAAESFASYTFDTYFDLYMGEVIRFHEAPTVATNRYLRNAIRFHDAPVRASNDYISRMDNARNLGR